MRKWPFIILFISLPAGAATCDLSDPQAKSKIDYINQRYDDFFRQDEERAEREARRQKGVSEVKEMREKHDLELKRAAQDYRREKKDLAKEEAMRIAWEAAQKARDKEIEIARLCEVQQRKAAEDLLKKGRKIPELKEFDLEGY